MIENQTIEGAFLNVKLEPQRMPLRTTAANRARPRPEPELIADIVTLRFEMQGKTVTELRAEFVVDRDTYGKAEAAGHFGLSNDAKSAPVDVTSFAEDTPIHILVRADLERVGPYQFDGLDLMNNENDLMEVVMTMTYEGPRSPYHELETWTFVSVQQEAGDGSGSVGFTRASR